MTMHKCNVAKGFVSGVFARQDGSLVVGFEVLEAGLRCKEKHQ